MRNILVRDTRPQNAGKLPDLSVPANSARDNSDRGNRYRATCQALQKRILKPGQYRGVNLNGIPQVLQAQVLVGAVLVVVVVGYRQNQDRCVQGILDDV